ncbi:MAG TPA: peptidase S41, partial [Thermoanaerobaculia bacterium]|nr:peptidase S41 [Thermoanaerobaculia bacterium]
MPRPGRYRFAPVPALAAVLTLTLAAAPAGAVDVHDTRMLADPAVSAEHVAFTYAGDLWVARHDGSGVRRLTTHAGRETGPRFSPDGRLLAFTGQYDGNTDVFVVPVEGGVPQRLTWHPGPDVAQGFTPDGTAVLFTSNRTVHTFAHRHLYTVPVAGGFPERVPVPTAHEATWSADGSRLAYLPDGEAFRTWKRYRGGTASRIWLYDPSDLSVVEIPRPEGRSNDTDPMWVGGTVYFLSDRAGELNLFSYDPATEEIVQRTFHDDFPVLAASAGGGWIVYEQAGYLHLYDPGSHRPRRLVLPVAADLVETRPRWASGAELVRSGHLSPSGARAVFELRGEIVTVPAEKGSPRNLTRTPGVHERSPVWSPKGDRIAWFSDASGEYQLHVAPQDGRGEVRAFALDGAGFYEDPKWSPDGKWISFNDNSWSLYLLEVATGRVRKVSSEPMYGPVKTLSHAWSPDSRFVAYTRNTPTYFQTLWLYSVADDRSHGVTEGLSDVCEPVFDRGGKYLYFVASTDVGLAQGWLDMTSMSRPVTASLYAVVLRRDLPSPVAPESDEEGAGDAKDEKDGKDPKGAKTAKDAKQPPEPVRIEPVRIDFEGLDQRIVALPVERANWVGLETGAEGIVFLLKAPVALAAED